jgi:hypothetical protein
MEDIRGKEIGWDEAVEKGGDYITLPEGEYDFTVESFERGRYEGNEKVPPCNRALLKLRIESPQGTAYVNESLLLYDKMQWKLAEFFMSLGVPEVDGKVRMNWQSVPQATGRALVEVIPGKNDPTKKYNRVKTFLPKPKKEFKAGEF